MAGAAQDKVLEQILDLLPADGTPVLNRIMRAMVSRRLGYVLSSEDYFTARDTLLRQGRVGRERGQGGKLFLLAAPAGEGTGTASAAAEAVSEAHLMPALGQFLAGAFTRDMDLPSGSVTIVQDISRIGPVSGQWMRPDFTLVSVMRFQFLPGLQVDVHSFELKAENGGSVLAVHEALAQTRFTHFGHLVWHLPLDSRARARLPEVEAQCDEHGIGLILATQADGRGGFEVRLEPQRKSTSPKVVDGFLESRLTFENRALLARALGRDN
ncbi:hypothetical protein [Xanthobacter sp. KR7-225]|uniref:hypothetical protein n=1 Tax=Xanthobacter sp. KR7-225 TaxID=3156613 RepID=UPI0032B41BC3